MTDLAVFETGEDALLTWNTGTPPFRVLRSDTPNFFSGNRLVAQDFAGNALTDVEALAHGKPSHFYRVLEAGEADPPGFALNPPRPVPFITQLTPDAGFPGDIVTIDGGNFADDGSLMTVTFDGLLADLLTATTTQLSVVVPDGALTGDVQVCLAATCSNRLLFMVIFADGFSDISSIAFEPGTGSLWVADRGSVDTIYEIDAAGALFARGNLGEPLLGHPSPADGSGRIYYGNSVVSQFNGGTIEYISSATNAEVFFDTAGAGGSDPVWCQGIAATDLEPDVAYYLDGNGMTVRRIVRNALAHDTAYGDRPFTFNAPAGARFDSQRNLYLSSTTEIYKILPQEAGVELVADGFTAAAGIDLSEASGIPILLVADEATGEIYLVNGETGTKDVVGSGFDGPVGVAFSEDPATGDLFYDVAEPTRILRLPDPQVEFLEKDDVRVLLSKQGESDDYPSERQTAPAQIEIQVKVVDAVDPAGSMVYFRLVDPKDPSFYLNGHKDDNLPTSPAGQITPSAVVAANGIATATLTIDPQYSGNNYRIEASLKPPPGFKKGAESKLYTAWKRFYIEHDKMYKEGEFLTQAAGAGQPEPARVFVANPETFAPGDAVHILAGDTIETAVGQETSEGEFRTVAAVGAGFVDLDAPLALSYAEPLEPPPDNFPYSFLAKISGGVFDVLPSAEKLTKAFDDGFTEWFFLPDSGFIPYWHDAVMEMPPPNPPAPSAAFIDARSHLFFKNLDRSVPRPFTNHIQLVSASRFEESPLPPPAHAELGLASATNTGPGPPASNWSWIFDDTIALLAPTNIQNVRDYVTAHELGHQLNVNPGAPKGHDEEQAWHLPMEPAVGCLMNPFTLLDFTGVHRFHANLGAPTQDLLCIRTHVNDLNQDSCPPFPGTTP